MIYPVEAKNEIEIAQRMRRPVFLKERPPISTACPNCGGYGSIWLQVASSGPHRSPPGNDLVTWFETGFYRVEDKLYPCPVCFDKTALLRYLWGQSGLELSERDWRFDFFNGTGKDGPVKKAYELLAVNPPRGWIVYYGDYGRGKSGLLKCLVAAAIRAGISARYVRSADILSEIRTTYGNDASTTEADITSTYGGIALLAVDEVDRIGSTAWAQSTMMTLLDTRYNRRDSLATVLATNLEPHQFPDYLGYLASRLKDGDRVMVAGKDLRG